MLCCTYPRFPESMWRGQQIEARVVDFNGEDRKISLSVKALQNMPEPVYEDPDVADVDIEAMAASEDVE